MKIIKYEDKAYPELLKKIKNPPKKIYIKGMQENLNTRAIAVVGSRNCTPYGEKWCEIFVKELVKYNLTIVSGMALGIDSIAHKTALKYGGKTIAVLPCGLENIFPQKNKNLFKKIIELNGTVISEYAPKTEAFYDLFLQRNRIVSGLSVGLLVVEAAYRSGTSVTARLALSQGKNVFCIPR